MSSTKPRVNWIDSLKGLASILVFLCHWACIFKPGLYFVDKVENTFESFYLGSIFNVLTNGEIGVQFFFICSGILITKSIYSGNKGNISVVTNKVISIFKITTIAIFFSFLIYKFGLMFHLEALDLCDKLSFVKRYPNYEPTLNSLLMDIIRSLFKGSEYNSSLWTMKHQLIGSLVIMVTSYFVNNYFANRNSNILIYSVIAIPFIYLDLNLVGFFFGAMIYDLYIGIQTQNTLFYSVVKNAYDKKIVKYASWCVGLYFACINVAPFSGIFAWLNFISPLEIFIRVFGIGLSLFNIMMSTNIQEKLSNKLLMFLGKLSPYTYITHWPILLSLGCYIFVKLYSVLDYSLLTIVIMLICLFAVLLISYCLYFIKKQSKKLLVK